MVIVTECTTQLPSRYSKGAKKELYVKKLSVEILGLHLR